ncbi:peptidase S41 [Clostridium polyendosporum]|uniref:Peptidase S41 n=1 Tax=Clostridium polyendosporum TaxID=69208 RepID=A0A919RXT9_9CLOT|nr:S41 family peptidase [Clostridium polyendosporum]GIM28267.1 peptidase S41 [Clostridium polyendosporum]
MNKENEEGKKHNLKKIGSVLLIVLVFVVTNASSFYVGNALALKGFTPAAADTDVAKSLQGINDVSKFKKLFDVRSTLYKYYDGNIDEDQLVEGAIKGMTASLNDPYTVFMSKKEYEDFEEKSEGSYMGLGLQVGVKDDKVTVVAPIEGSPAEKAGIIPGDVILKVNDTDVSGKELDKAISLMKGKEKAEVKLAISREGKGTFDVKVMRDVIKMISVKGEIVDKTIGYIQINGFEQETAKDFQKKLKELEDKGMKALILDLRGNPGGYLNECVDVVSNFIPKGKTVVSTIDKYKTENKSNSKGGIAIGMPLVVLVNEGSASASEIVSGAIRDYKIGTLVGKTTFGKGVVQVVLPDKTDGTALKVTISKYYTPNGENIHKKGIKPDVEVDYPKELLSKSYNRGEDPQFNKALEIINEKIK